MKTLQRAILSLAGSLSLIFGPAEAQSPNPIPVSPNAASLGKYAEAPVGTFTGIPSISIPIYEVKEGNISLPVSLNYHAGGIKVEEVASSVGLGWSLNAGGMISRTVRGGKDRFNGANYYERAAEFRNADIKQRIPLIKSITEGDIDTQPDIFHYNFGGYSGKFILFPDGKFHSIPLNNLDIKLDESGTDVQRWIVTDPNGIKYVFGKSFDNRIANEGNSVTSGTSSSGDLTSWYLVEITDASSNRVELKYETTDYWFPGADIQTATYGSLGNYVSSSTTSTVNKIRGVRLSEIVFSGGRLIFTPQAFERQDLVGDHALGSITVESSDQNVPNRTFSFGYGYFGASTNAVSSRRLRLESFGEQGAMPHVFAYESFHQLPDRLSFDRDHWGYYNAKGNSTHLPSFSYAGVNVPLADKRANEHSVKAGMLTKITYPTGGSTEYGFEINEVVGTTHRDDDDYIRKDAVAQLVNDKFYEETFAIANGVGQSAKLFYSGDTFDYLGKGCLRIRISGVDNQMVYTIDSQNPLPPNNGMQLQNGTYKIQLIWTYESGCVLQENPEEEVWIAAQLVWQEPNTENPVQYANTKVGGVRVKTIVSKAGADSPAVTTEFIYNNFYDPALSSGWMLTDPVYHHHYWNSDGSGGWNVKLNSSSNYPLLTNGGGYAGYSNVEVRYGAGGVNGRTRYSFTNVSQYPDIAEVIEIKIPEPIRGDQDIEENEMPFKPATSFDWRRGRLEEQSDYEYADGSFRIVRKVENDFQFVSPPGLATTAEAVITAEIGVTTPTVEGGWYIHVYSYKYYDTVTDFPFLASSSETLYSYSPDQEITARHTGYSYHNFSHLNPSRVREKINGGYRSTYYTYPDDYAAGTGFIDDLKASHLISAPIEKVVVLEDGDGENPRVVEGELYRYKQGGKGLRDEVWRLESSNPLALPVFKFSHLPQGQLPSPGAQAGFGADLAYRRKLRFHRYDGGGNILQLQGEEDVQVSYVWGYNRSYPVAEVRNASYQDIEAVLGGAAAVEAIASSAVLSQSQIDKLNRVRDLLPEAMVTVYTYAPLVGMASATDPNGRTTFYEYDGFGRLESVKDHEGNVVQAHEYRYAGQ